MSPEDSEALIMRILEQAAKDQAETEHLYRGLPGMDDEKPH